MTDTPETVVDWLSDKEMMYVLKLHSKSGKAA
jgi:hypothetical protein